MYFNGEFCIFDDTYLELYVRNERRVQVRCDGPEFFYSFYLFSLMETIRTTFNWSDGCIWDACGGPPEDAPIFSTDTLAWWFSSAVSKKC